MKFKECINELNLPEQIKGLMVKKIKTTLTKGDPKYYEEDYEERFYDILDKKKKKVGSLTMGSITGSIYGELWGRDFPNLFDYGHGKDAWKAGPIGHLHTFFKSKTGLKWLDMAIKQGKII